MDSLTLSREYSARTLDSMNHIIDQALRSIIGVNPSAMRKPFQCNRCERWFTIPRGIQPPRMCRNCRASVMTGLTTR